MNINISHKQVHSSLNGPLGKTSKRHGSTKLFTHPPMQPTNSFQTVNRGQKGPETSQLPSVVLATIPQDPGEVAEVVYQGTIYRV